MNSAEEFNKLVKLTARAFYNDFTSEEKDKCSPAADRGIAVVTLDALTRRQWVREEGLARELRFSNKQLRKTLQFLESEKLVIRENMQEEEKVNIFSADTAFFRKLTGREEQNPHSYCCLDYAQIHDVVTYRLQWMKIKLINELANTTEVQEYVCQSCGERYAASYAMRLVSFEDDSLHCESCNAELVAENASQDIGENARHDKLRDLLGKMKVQLKPLTDQLSRVKDLEAPAFGPLQAWLQKRPTMPLPFYGEAKQRGAVKEAPLFEPKYIPIKRDQYHLPNNGTSAVVHPSTSRKRQRDDDGEDDDVQ